MTHFMAWVVLLSAGIAACAFVAELILRPKLATTRWVWVSSLGAVLALAAVASVMPVAEIETSLAPPTIAIDGIAAPPMTIAVEGAGIDLALRVADSVLPFAWIFASLILLATILVGQRRLTIERGAAASISMHGREVLLTENIGPAVAGIGRPIVILPRWVLALDARSQELLLAHEFEHARRGDTRLLLAGAVSVALMPWNPVVWWIARRLRLAVEQDCDARVLARHPDVRRYADLLLMAASRPTVSTRLLAAHFGEHRSDLDRRIHAMTDTRLKMGRVLAASAVAVCLIAVSCEAPRPAPLAPAGKDAPTPQVVSSDDALYEFQVEKPVKLATGSAMPSYPEILKQAGVEGEVLVSFVVNEDGAADPTSFKVIRSTHELFATAVKQSLSAMRFVAAEVGGKKVKQLVQQPFSFSLPGDRSASNKATTENVVVGNRLTEIPARNRPPRIITRGDAKYPVEPVNFEVLDSGGDVVSRYTTSTMPKEVRVDDISSIEVWKPAKCTGTTSPCPLIRITLKKGREAAYRTR